MLAKKRIYFITGGGTGGHIYPAVAVADALFKTDDAKIYYVGNKKNLEFGIVQQKGYDFLSVDISGMPRKACFDFIIWCAQLFFAVLKCMIYIGKYRPDVVFGTGGYVSAPILIASRYLKVPYVLHDCDANPGLVTKRLAKGAKSVSLAFDCALKLIDNGNCFVNGNPIREDFKTLTKSDARKKLGLENKLTLCVMGGSQGAKSINFAAAGILKTLSKEYNMQVIFQTGKNKFNLVQEHLSVVYPEYENDKNLIVQPYFDNMVEVLKASDIAVSRAGSLSISELCASGVVPILVPYPYAAADHQRVNAKFMKDKGAGLYIEDESVTSAMLLDVIVDFVENPDKLDVVRNKALELAKYDGVCNIVNQIKVVI